MSGETRRETGGPVGALSELPRTPFLRRVGSGALPRRRGDHTEKQPPKRLIRQGYPCQSRLRAVGKLSPSDDRYVYGSRICTGGVGRSDIAALMNGGERIRDQVARWRDDLLDLTGRNRLLRFRHTKTSSLEIDSPAAQAILDRLLTGRSHEWAIHIPEDEGSAVEPLMASPSPDFVGVPAVDLAGGGPVLRTTKGTAKEVRAIA
jgi:hypothetical protein